MPEPVYLKYAGIGSRKTPKSILKRMKRIGKRYALDGYILRSGAADGADTAFEEGCDSVNGKKEIYLPWENFNGHSSELYGVCQEALEMAESYHPAWHRCTEAAKKFHARNCYQVLGLCLDDPVDVVICWTKDAELVGGTAQALRIAQDYGIKIINLGDPNAKA